MYHLGDSYTDSDSNGACQNLCYCFITLSKAIFWYECEMLNATLFVNYKDCNLNRLEYHQWSDNSCEFIHIAFEREWKMITVNKGKKWTTMLVSNHLRKGLCKDSLHFDGVHPLVHIHSSKQLNSGDFDMLQFSSIWVWIKLLTEIYAGKAV